MMIMIELLQIIAFLLRPWRLLLLGMSVFSLLLAGLSVTDNPWLASDEWLVPAVVSLMWSLMFYSLSFLFLSVPPQPDSNAQWRYRLVVRVIRTGLGLLALGFVALSLALLVLTWQLVRAAFL
ncbi:MAG: hypothetical protein OXD01_14970 [Gammaproteobacteria bacterium]|nr:hypothetical protein [Gammaproteobacteria bacterium]